MVVVRRLATAWVKPSRAVFLVTSVLTSQFVTTTATASKSLYDFTVKGIDGSTVPLEKFRSHPVALVVNTASGCVSAEGCAR